MEAPVLTLPGFGWGYSVATDADILANNAG